MEYLKSFLKNRKRNKIFRPMIFNYNENECYVAYCKKMNIKECKKFCEQINQLLLEFKEGKRERELF